MLLKERGVRRGALWDVRESKQYLEYNASRISNRWKIMVVKKKKKHETAKKEKKRWGLMRIRAELQPSYVRNVLKHGETKRHSLAR